MKKSLILLFISIIFITGCGKQSSDQPETKKELTLIDYVTALPNAYFLYYFPVGTTNPIVREKAIAIRDLEHQYIEFKVKDTVSGTVHWAIKGLIANDGTKLLMVSDMLQTDVVSQHLYILKKSGEREWTDETGAYFGPVMKEIQKLNVEKLVRDHYEDSMEAKKLKNGRFIFSATGTEIIGGIGPRPGVQGGAGPALGENGVDSAAGKKKAGEVGNPWSVEFPVYAILWNGEKFVLKTDEIGSETSVTNTAP